MRETIAEPNVLAPFALQCKSMPYRLRLETLTDVYQAPPHSATALLALNTRASPTPHFRRFARCSPAEVTLSQLTHCFHRCASLQSPTLFPPVCFAESISPLFHLSPSSHNSLTRRDDGTPSRPVQSPCHANGCSRATADRQRLRRQRDPVAPRHCPSASSASHHVWRSATAYRQAEPAQGHREGTTRNP